MVIKWIFIFFFKGQVIGPPREEKLARYYNEYLVEMQESIEDPGQVMS